jgi:hypothetical protein
VCEVLQQAGVGVKPPVASLAVRFLFFVITLFFGALFAFISGVLMSIRVLHVLVQSLKADEQPLTVFAICMVTFISAMSM